MDNEHSLVDCIWSGTRRYFDPMVGRLLLNGGGWHGHLMTSGRAAINAGGLLCYAAQTAGVSEDNILRGVRT